LISIKNFSAFTVNEDIVKASSYEIHKTVITGR